MARESDTITQAHKACLDGADTITTVIATHNKGKLQEFRQALGSNWQVQTQADLGISEAVESGATFIENALIKARHAFQHTQGIVLADDSGLVVPALGGKPGLLSARYSGGDDEANNLLLLKNMQQLLGIDRAAFYITVLVLLRAADDPSPLIAEGRWHGTIATEARGRQGFGYDPLFYLPEFKMTAAELTEEQKNSVSHRGKALLAFKQELSKITADLNCETLK